MKKFFLFLISFVVLSAFSIEVKAQLTVDTSLSVPQMVQSYLLGSGVTVTNVTYTGKPGSVGAFNTGATPTNLGLTSGLVLSNGQTNGTPPIGSAAINLADHNNAGASDPLLENLVPASTNIFDASVLEFDFVPFADTMKFRYVFASEEYPDYVSAMYADVFGFFVTGPNPAGGNYTNQNIALIPGTSQPVTIANVNNGPGNSGPCNNCAYYIGNTGGLTIVYNGFTTVLTAWCLVSPCASYHLKLAIGDAGDGWWDSSVFLEANSFSTNNIEVTATDNEICTGESTTLTAVGANTFLWMPDSVPGPVNTVSPTITTTYTVIGTTALGCTGMNTFTVYVSPTPTVNPEANLTYCHGANVPLNQLSSPVDYTILSWTNNNPSIGLATSGVDYIPAFVATNTGTAPVTATITVIPTYDVCEGPPLTFTITVNPIPTVAPVTDQFYCPGVNAPLTALTGPVSGTVFSWTNSNTDIGLGAGGTGSIPAFTTTNTLGSPISGTITVTPTANGCAGPPETFTITVYPPSSVSPVADQTYCAGAAVPVTPITGPTQGTIFTWSNSNTGIGLGGSGTGDIPAFTAENTTGAPITATITITPSSNGCQGIPETFTITVNPTPIVNAIADQVYCIGSSAPITELEGTVAGTTFSWVNDNTAIGLGASGTGDVPGFFAQNITGTTLTATITITPSANGCTGETETYNITVYATSVTVNLGSMTDADCLGKALGALDIEVVGGESPYTYAWSNGAVTEDIEGLDAGVYAITATDNKGCTSKDTSFQIVARPETPLKLNNVFSPNGDGKNDMWIIGNIDLYPENEVFVFNRWGNQVYSEKGYNNEKPLVWDGSNLTEGTYLYVLKINMCGVDKTYKDYITIVR